MFLLFGCLFHNDSRHPTVGWNARSELNFSFVQGDGCFGTVTNQGLILKRNFRQIKGTNQARNWAVNIFLHVWSYRFVFFLLCLCLSVFHFRWGARVRVLCECVLSVCTFVFSQLMHRHEKSAEPVGKKSFFQITKEQILKKKWHRTRIPIKMWLPCWSAGPDFRSHLQIPERNHRYMQISAKCFCFILEEKIQHRKSDSIQLLQVLTPTN